MPGAGERPSPEHDAARAEAGDRPRPAARESISRPAWTHRRRSRPCRPWPCRSGATCRRASPSSAPPGPARDPRPTRSPILPPSRGELAGGRCGSWHGGRGGSIAVASEAGRAGSPPSLISSSQLGCGSGRPAGPGEADRSLSASAGGEGTCPVEAVASAKPPFGRRALFLSPPIPSPPTTSRHCVPQRRLPQKHPGPLPPPRPAPGAVRAGKELRPAPREA